MPVESISCPNCGAPLRQASFDDPWLCLYCNSLIRVEGDGEAPSTSLQHGLKADEMEAVKQMLVSGQRQAAIDRFEELSGLETEQVERIIDKMGADFTIKTIFTQQLTRGGMIMVAICAILVPFSLVAWATGGLNQWLALTYLAIGCYGLYIYGRGALNTLRYRKAPVAQARTLQFTQIGKIQRGRLRVRAFLIALEVMPKDEPPFRTQTVIPVLEDNVERVKKGEIFLVKYLPGKPESVIYHQEQKKKKAR